MAAVAHAVQDVVPAPEERAGVAVLYDFMRAHQTAGRNRPERRFLLAGAEPGDQVEVPEEVFDVLRIVVQAMSEGKAVQITPQSRRLTTQQAADLLRVSRPTLIRFLDDGRLPFERVGSHRRLRLDDVLAFREQRRQEQYAALDAMRADDEADPEETLAALRRVRTAVADKRRARGTSEA